jgi:DNA (cytosine-5)-methyltransferase 1
VLSGKPYLVSLRGTEATHCHADSLDRPLRTISAGGSHHALVAAFLAKHYGGVVGQPLDRTSAR